MSFDDQLRRLIESGFTLETFDRFPRAVGALRDGCIALLKSTPAGLKLIGVPGWRMGEVMGVLVEEGGTQVFRAKAERVEATPERLATLAQFRQDLERALIPQA